MYYIKKNILNRLSAFLPRLRGVFIAQAVSSRALKNPVIEAGRAGNQPMQLSGATMNEQKAHSEGVVLPSPQKKSDEDIRKSIEAEIQEMEKYKWYLGVQLQHDPLQDRSLNEIYCEWIAKYAADFRKFWEGQKFDSRQSTT